MTTTRPKLQVITPDMITSVADRIDELNGVTAETHTFRETLLNRIEHVVQFSGPQNQWR